MIELPLVIRNNSSLPLLDLCPEALTTGLWQELLHLLRFRPHLRMTMPNPEWSRILFSHTMWGNLFRSKKPRIRPCVGRVVRLTVPLMHSKIAMVSDVIPFRIGLPIKRLWIEMRVMRIKKQMSHTAVAQTWTQSYWRWRRVLNVSQLSLASAIQTFSQHCQGQIWLNSRAL